MDHSRIQSNPAVMMGKPVIRGTRLAVEAILLKLSDGWSVDDVIQAYPHVAREDVLASLAFAADHLQNETVWAAE